MSRAIVKSTNGIDVATLSIDILRSTPLLDPIWYRNSYEDLRDQPINAASHYFNYGAAEGRDPHPLFSTKFYVERNSSALAVGMNSLVHYILHGAQERRDPHPLFDTKFYLEQCPDAKANPLIHFLDKGAGEGRSPHPLFDAAFYLEKYPDVQSSGLNPFVHYVLHGAREHRDPHPLFDTKFYTEQCPDAEANPLVHFLVTGAGEGRSPHPLFDARFYLETYPDVQAAGVNPFLHYILDGAREQRDPHPLFDQKFYLERYPDVHFAGVNPFIHYVLYGGRDRRDPHPLFATAYYLNQNPDLAQTATNPLAHYVAQGWKSGLNPHPLFHVAWYLKENPDVAEAGWEPLSHYVAKGSAEGRCPNRLFDPAWYREQNGDVAAARREPLTHYYHGGHAEGRRASPLFDPSWYREHHPDAVASGMEPLSYYLSTGATDDRDLDEYSEWLLQYDTISDDDRRSISAAISAMKVPPLISVVMPVYETPEVYLRAAIDSVRGQLYPHWELCIADDASKTPHVRQILEEYRALDPRIKICLRDKNGHISATTNSALAMAGGVVIALLDHDDLLREHALYMVAAVLIEHPEADLIFSDEDKIDPKGRRYSPYFKSDWNLDLLLGQNMFSHLGVYRRSLVEEIGGFRSEYDGSQDYDLVLRAQSVITRDRIRHIPHVLYHWRAIPGSVASVSEDAKPYALIRARLAIADYLAKSGSVAEVLPSAHAAFSRVRFALPDPPPPVTIVVSNVDTPDSGLRCVNSLLQRTDYADFEVLIIDEGEGANGKAQFSDPRIRVLSHSGPNTRSAINNFAAAHASGQLICFLSGNAEIVSGDWLSEMASHASRPGIGAVGALLSNPDDGRIQHAGIVLNSERVAQPAYQRLKSGGFGYFGRATLTQNLSAVSADCLVMRKAVFDELGGFNESDLPTLFGDVDLCLRLGDRGYQIVWTPYAELSYHPTKADAQRKAGFHRNEARYMRRRWGGLIDRDPYQNPNLRINGSGFNLRFPPGVPLPWRVAKAETSAPAAPTREERLVAASGLFNPTWYLAQNPDVMAAKKDPLQHYLGSGWREGRRPNPIFDPTWYLREYPDVAAFGIEPLTHYIGAGSLEGRRPGPSFDQGKYLQENPEVDGMRLFPLAHYLLSNSRGPERVGKLAAGRLTDLPDLPLPDLFELRGLTPRGSIAVVLHLFHADLWEEMRTAIERISHPFDLFVSLVAGVSGHMKGVIKNAFPDAYVFEFPENRGRDIAPFLAMLQTGALFRYALICKLHTKRSTYVDDGDAWRRALVDGILGSSPQVDRIVSRFRDDPDLGMVVADGNIYSKYEHWSGNEKFLEELLPRIGVSTEVEGKSFPGGSIFWIRSFLLRSLLGARINLNDLEPEPMPVNAALGHAVERMIGLICADAGMRFAEWSDIKDSEPQIAPSASKVHLFAYYLPQFHPVAENDKWWGAGFTEWTNVTRAKPLYAGQRQPRLPGELGFYDLRLAETRDAQAALAREYGLSGFCYYYYWFNGRRILERPLDEVLASGKPDFPFLICWANEPWSRNWDGLNDHVLLPQTYEPGWEGRFASDVAPLLRDRRYFRLDGKPMLLIYRIQHIPEAASAMRELRASLAAEGVPEVHLGAAWVHFGKDTDLPADPASLGLDAYFEFPPHRIHGEQLKPRPSDLPEGQLRGLYDYGGTADAAIRNLDAPVIERRHRGVMAAFDNTSRRGGEASVFHGATPTNFRRWLRAVIRHEREQAGDRVVFINAWNEWAEGACLEPDSDFGRGWLEAVASAADG